MAFASERSRQDLDRITGPLLFNKISSSQACPKPATKVDEGASVQGDKPLAVNDIPQCGEYSKGSNNSEKDKGQVKRKKKKSEGSELLSTIPRTCGLCLGILNGVGNPNEWCRCH